MWRVSVGVRGRGLEGWCREGRSGVEGEGEGEGEGLERQERRGKVEDNSKTGCQEALLPAGGGAPECDCLPSVLLRRCGS